MARLCLSSFRRCGGRRLRRLLQLAGRGPRIICLESNKEDLKVGKDVLKPWVKASLRCFGPKVLHVLGSPSLERKIISMVSGEPFAKECEGLPCDCQFWHHWAQVDALRFALKSSCIFLPRAFRVKAALLGCRDLWRRRKTNQWPRAGGGCFCHQRAASGRAGSTEVSLQSVASGARHSQWGSHALLDRHGDAIPRLPGISQDDPSIPKHCGWWNCHLDWGVLQLSHWMDSHSPHHPYLKTRCVRCVVLWTQPHDARCPSGQESRLLPKCGCTVLFSCRRWLLIFGSKVGRW